MKKINLSSKKTTQTTRDTWNVHSAYELHEEAKHRIILYMKKASTGSYGIEVRLLTRVVVPEEGVEEGT